MLDDTLILVFTQAIIPGSVKTRLTPYLSKEQAADFAESLQRYTLDLLTESNLPPVRLQLSPNCRTANIPQLLREYPLPCDIQRGSDLGERMCHAAVVALKQVRQVILIGTDCVVMTADYIRHAVLHLQTHDAVIGPAEDGGYVLLGLRRVDPCLFQDVEWGTSSVLLQTRKNMRDNGWSFCELETLWDVDEPQDYQRYLKLDLSV